MRPIPLPLPHDSADVPEQAHHVDIPCRRETSKRDAALIGLGRDIAALLSIFIESLLSLLYGSLYRALALVGLIAIRPSPSPSQMQETSRGRGRGAVVILGAREEAGQSLTLHLAKEGYTVFPLVPLPSPTSPPTSEALSSLLLAWGGMQKRLRARDAGHSGDVVPVMIDPPGAGIHVGDGRSQMADQRGAECAVPGLAESEEERGDEEGQQHQYQHHHQQGRFTHASQTIRAYCRTNHLSLTSIVVITKSIHTHSLSTSTGGSSSKLTTQSLPPSEPSETVIDLSDEKDILSRPPRMYLSTFPPVPVPSPAPRSLREKLYPPDPTATAAKTVRRKALSSPWDPDAGTTATTNKTISRVTEDALSSLYRHNVLDPLCIIDELADVLFPHSRLPYDDSVDEKEDSTVTSEDGEASKERESGRIILLDIYRRPHFFGQDDGERSTMKIVQTAREEMASVVRERYAEQGIEVCEVRAGPLVESRSRSRSGHSSLFTKVGKLGKVGTVPPKPRTEGEVAEIKAYKYSNSTMTTSTTSRWMWELLDQILQVDDALLFSAVRRGMTDTHPRRRYYAGLPPFVADLPGIGVVRWALGKLKLF